MTTAPTPDEHPPAEPASPSEAPPSQDGVDWPDRSHWSEFDLAIEAGRVENQPAAPAPSSEVEAPAEDDA